MGKHINKRSIRPLIERFEEKVMYEPNTGCHFWIANINHKGYGMFRADKMRSAHRVSWELYVGPIPTNKILCHSCDNPLCVNPDHIWLGTYKENSDDMYKKGRSSHASGSLHKRSKLKENQILEIKNSTLSQKELKEKYDVSQQLISRIQLGGIWKHVV